LCSGKSGLFIVLMHKTIKVPVIQMPEPFLLRYWRFFYSALDVHTIFQYVLYP
jgi:hypothetical protein